MRKNIALLTVVLAVSVVATGCKNKPPLTPTRPAGPDSVALNTQATYRSWTTDPNRDAIRYVIDWDDTGFDTSDYLPSGDTAGFSHTWTAVGTYAVRVRAQDENDNWSVEWSDARNVTVYSGSGNNPPNPPAKPSGPASESVNVWVRFSTSALDPDGDSVQVKFHWGDNLSSSWSEFAPGGTTVTDSVRYAYRGAKQVYAIARDTKGDTSSWSEPASITILARNTPPDKPALLGPARGIKDGPMYLFYGRAADPQGDNLEYRFIWGDGRVSNWTAPSPHNLPVAESTRYTALGSYNVRCVARDIDGAVSDTSDPLTFEVVGEGEILWSVSTGECVASPAWATIRDYYEMMRPGIVIGNLDGRLRAVDAWQGLQAWEVGGPDEPLRSSPAISENGQAIYVGGGDGRLYAFGTDGGWKWQAPWTPSPDSIAGEDLGATPVIDGANVYCAGEPGYVYKLTDVGASATRSWSFKARDEIHSSPVLTASHLVVCDDSGYVYWLNPADGAPVHEFHCDGDITGSPAVGSGGNIYVGTDQGSMYALSSTGTVVWRYAPDSAKAAPVIASAVITPDGGIVFGNDLGYVFKLNAGSGLPVSGWPVLVSATSGIASTAAACADGVIYVVSENNRLHALKADGTAHWANPVELVLPPPRRAPGPRRLAVDDLTPSVLIDQYGIIYAASVDDGLFAIAGRPTGTLANTAWPMFHRDIRHSGKSGAW
ncbi:MAG: PQQ-binding-like beta-propeller repeat protein [bacterium]